MDEPLNRTHVLQIQAAMQAGYRLCLEDYGKAKAYISMNQFLWRFGQGIAQNWIDEGLIKPVRHGKNTSKWLISVKEAETLAVTYHPELICERKRKATKSSTKTKQTPIHESQR